MNERNWQILERFIQYHIYGDVELIHSRSFQEFSISMVVFYNDEDDEDDKAVKFVFKSINTGKIIFKVIYHIRDHQQIIYFLKDKLDDYMLCSECGHYTTDHYVYDVCEDCFIHRITLEDNCAICLSNDYEVWVKTPCNHHFHRKCYNKIKPSDFSIVCPAIKCPLCRNVHFKNELEIL
jgi:hypothetical protein